MSDESGLAVFVLLRFDSSVGDLTVFAGEVTGVVFGTDPRVRDWFGLCAVLERCVEDVVGRLGAELTEAVPAAALLVLSVLVSVFAIREAVVPTEEDIGVIREVRRFSAPIVDAVADEVPSPPFIGVFRTDDGNAGRVGGFVMVVPLAREESALVLVVVGEVVVGFFASMADFFESSPAFGLLTLVDGGRVLRLVRSSMILAAGRALFVVFSPYIWQFWCTKKVANIFDSRPEFG